MTSEKYKLRLIGEEIASYQIQDKIWQGATSTVFKARNFSENAPYGPYVAFKALHVYRDDPRHLNQFVREAKILMRLEHPYIVKVFRLIRAKTLIMLMEYIEGASLRQMVKERDLPQEVLFNILTKIGEALSFVHRNRIVHNDVKPENVLVSHDLATVKLIDFGYADILSWWRQRKEVFGGTEKYMAPEHRSGETDERTDIYSFGVMTEELLMGRVDGEKEYLKDFLLKATQHNPADRHQSMDHLLYEFRFVKKHTLPHKE